MDADSSTTTFDDKQSTTDFSLGESVVDRDADDPNTAVVVALPDAPAYDYPLDALDVWREADPEALAGLCDDESVRTYTYPVERLREVSDE